MATPTSARVKHNGITDETVRQKTGRTWAQWFEALDAANGETLNHTELTLLLYEQHKVSGWWCQMVAVGYERARGIRDVNQKCNGERSVSVSKTILAPLPVVYALCADEKARTAWLKTKGVVVRKANENKNIRATWPDGSDVELRFTAKSGEKCQIVADHGKLAGAETVEKVRTLWSQAFDRLKTCAES